MSDLLSRTKIPVCLWPASSDPRLQLASEILLVLNEAESYHWSPSLRVEAVVHANTRCHRGRCPTIAETLAKLGADEKTGLTDAEVQARLKKYGPNALVEKQKNTFAALLHIFGDPFHG